MSEMRKITAVLPAKLLEAAMRNSGVGLTETLRLVLQDFNHSAASRELLAMRGSVKFESTAEELRSK